MEVIISDNETFQSNMLRMKKECVESRFMEAHVIAGVSIESGKIADRYKSLPLIKLVLPLKKKWKYKDSMIESIWSMLSDPDAHTIVLFLEIHFQKVPAPLKIYMILDTILTNIEDKSTINILDKKSVQLAIERGGSHIYEPDQDSVEGLMWMRELIKSHGKIVIGDGGEPDIIVDSIPLDMPMIITNLYRFVR